VLPTTEEFVYLLHENGATIHSFLAKPYSIDESVATRIEQHLNLKLTRKSYRDLETTNFLDQLLQSAFEASRKDDKRIVIIDVGGYFAKPLTRLASDDDQHLLAGVVEDTTFGHNRYLAEARGIKCPIFSVARSALKEIEARFVGSDAVAAVEDVLRRNGVSLPGRTALVVGYGMIGKNVARALQANDLRVHVYDKHDHKMLAAFVDGYGVNRKETLLKKADLIISATGDPAGALSYDDIEDCRDNAILASVGSKDTEFDVERLRRQSTQCLELSPHIKKYRMINQNCVFVVKDGTAVNFIRPSIPIEVLDLVFSEILICVVGLVAEDGFDLHKVHDSDDEVLNAIAKTWLRNVNRQ
jgi:adenosylhomocysteinase